MQTISLTDAQLKAMYRACNSAIREQEPYLNNTVALAEHARLCEVANILRKTLGYTDGQNISE